MVVQKRVSMLCGVNFRFRLTADVLDYVRSWFVQRQVSEEVLPLPASSSKSPLIIDHALSLLKLVSKISGFDLIVISFGQDK